jgi:hypothetical protein
MQTPDQAPVLVNKQEDAQHPKSGATHSNYLTQALNAAFFRKVEWDRLPEAGPALVFFACLLAVLLELVAGYFSIEGEKRFYPQAIAAGWLGTLALVWACWASLQRDSTITPVSVVQEIAGPSTDTTEPASANTDAENTTTAIKVVPSLSKLFAVSMLFGLFVYALTSLIYVPLHRANVFAETNVGSVLQWVAWGAGPAWVLLAQIVLLARATPAAVLSSAAVLILLASNAIQIWVNPQTFWYPDYSQEAQDDSKAKWSTTHLQPAKLLKQSSVLDAALSALPAQRPGVVDTYVITYSPYASEDVFLKEGEVVTRVMSERFATGDRDLRLVNHASTVETLAWATPENLKKALDHVGKLIDPAEDIVLIHFASHGGSDGKLSAEFWPLQIDTLTGKAVRTMLDDANIPVRILSVSACFSGSWIEPLRTEGTFIMTASDADHTSYGCGRKSELTFFTRAVFDEQLSKETRSFEDAFNAARPIIEAREKEAGKKDGYSNPQIFVGTVARARMSRWTEEASTAVSGKKI